MIEGVPQSNEVVLKIMFIDNIWASSLENLSSGFPTKWDKAASLTTETSQKIEIALAGFQWGPTFPIFPTFPYFFLSAPTFPYFFMKMPYYPYFFSLKCHLRVKFQKFFLARFACLGFIN